MLRYSEILVEISMQSRFSSKAEKPQLLLFLQGCSFDNTMVYVKHYLDDVYFPISLCCRSHITVLLGKGFTVCSASASKYDLDLDIPLVHEFRARCILSEFNDLFFWIGTSVSANCFMCMQFDGST